MTNTTIIKSDSKTLCCKYCDNPEQYDDYFLYFETEFKYMKSLEQLMCKAGNTHLYSQLFPLYHSYGRTDFHKPCICMEHIEGCTLEHKLCEHCQNVQEPAHILTKQQILHIYEQLNTAFHWLYQVGIFYLDLNSKNILVLNDNYDIKLIDFTECYYSKESNIPHRLLDSRINTCLPIGAQLRNAAALLFTRLFFYGHEHYCRYFSLKTQTNRTFFSNYGHLLDCLFYPDEFTFCPDKDSLSYWTNWYEQLLRYFT